MTPTGYSGATARGSSSHVEDYRRVRADTERLCEPLCVEDFGLQAMPDTSPPKWHLAHTSWFFEQFLLLPHLPGYRPFHPQFDYLFNSYYNSLGPQFPRPQRGVLSRPTVQQVYEYRAAVDEAMARLLEMDVRERPVIEARTVLGLHHEQQHQELLLTDVKYSLSVNPLAPAYRVDLARAPGTGADAPGWCEFDAGMRMLGHAGAGFAFDNESPPHRAWLPAFALADRLVTNGEYREFVEAGGYEDPSWWLSDGWRTVAERAWRAPLYWQRDGGTWRVFTLGGMRDLDPDEPVCHVSLYEADAYARFRASRLPREHEWEAAAQQRAVAGNLRGTDRLHPCPARGGEDRPRQLFGDAWEWTASSYAPYPGYRPDAGALGEYNGKFMANQFVLRGGSCVTPDDHVRATYRNFFYPADRWQFSGIRLAQDR